MVEEILLRSGKSHLCFLIQAEEMSGFLYRGRHCGADQRARPKSMMDFACGETDKGPPVQMHSLREFEQHLNDLKKENFSLKLRIYFLEEKIQQKFEESSDDVHKRNIELKVEVESLKTELEEKQELLDRALSTVESLSDQNEAELQRCLAERQEEISHMQEILETKVQLLQEEAELARDEAKRMATLANSEAQRCLALEREMEEKMEESEGSEGLLTGKERVIEELTQQKSSLHLQVEELEARLHNLSSTVEKHGGAKRLIEEQRGQLSHYESAAGRCVGELQEAQGQVRSLQAKIRESENRNQKLQQCLGEMELELRSAREEAQQQERNIQNMSDAVSSKEAEVSELYRVIEEQNKMLRSLKELVNSNQLQQLQASGAENDRGRGEVLALQASLFQAQLELEADQRAQRRAGRTQKDLGQALQRLESDLRGVLQYRREVERHNQELQLALEKARSALQEREEQLRDSEQERRRQTEERDKTVRELKTSLQTKDRLLEDYCEMLEEPKEKSDSLLQKLRLRIKERDRALERAVDEKFRCVEEMEEEARRLQLLLREKERDLERQRCVLANNEETITSLEALVRGKTLELEQVCDACRSVRAQQQESEERQGSALRERDAIIGQLQAALHARTQEAQDLQCSLLTQIQSAPGDVLEELKVRLQLKDRLFQEVLADRTHQAQEHQDQIQDLLRSLSARDQYIQECASRLGEVITEQTSRLQELRTQLSSGLGSRPDSAADLALELQAAQEELRLAMRREKDSQELSRSQAAQLDSLSRTVHMKEEIIRDLQRQMVDPQGLHLVERLTREVQELRERLVQEDRPSARGPVMGPDQPSGSRQPQIGGLSSEDEDEADNNVKSEYTEEPTTKSCGGRWPALSQDVLADGQRLMEVKQLVEQKKVVERELRELKAQLEKAGFSSLSQMRKALFSLQTENEDLKQQLAEEPTQMDEQKVLEGEEEEELDVTIEEEETSELWEAWEEEPSLCQARVHGQDERREERCDGQNDVLAKKTARLQHESQELQERLMVSEATVQAQAEQLKDYRDLLTETAVQQDSKQVQVDLQDLGYETCGRSENEAEREDASSPEFDDLEMCTSLDCSSQWWSTMSTNSSSTFSKTPTQTHGHSDEVLSLRRLVKDLRSQLSRSQGVICELQSRLHSLSVDNGPSTTCRVNWSSQASSLQSGAEDNEGWQSSDGARLASHPDKGIQELVSRMDALEDQLRKGSKTPVPEDGKSATWPGKFDTLIQAQARELSHLRQQLREGQGVCSILTQHLADTTKVFEELLRANDIDYYMGQSFREHLAQSSTLAQRVSAKISAHHSKDPDEKTELLAIRLSKELQQKDKVIESLRTKLNHHHHPHCFDTPCSSHALSDTTDQSDRISYMSDEHGSANEDLELCSDVDAASELGEEETRTSARVGTDCHSQSVPPSVVSFHQTPSCLSCPSMLCSSLPHKMAQVQSQTGFSTPQSKPLHGFAFPHHHHHHQQQQHPDPSGFLPLSYQQFHHSPFSSAASSSSLDASLAMKAGASLLESSALWDVAYGGQTMRVGADLSLGSSGYQSCKSHTDHLFQLFQSWGKMPLCRTLTDVPYFRGPTWVSTESPLQ
ncbi:myomegalin isoform 2-T3 [Pholidichthys leucotaenia]